MLFSSVSLRHLYGLDHTRVAIANRINPSERYCNDTFVSVADRACHIETYAMAAAANIYAQSWVRTESSSPKPSPNPALLLSTSHPPLNVLRIQYKFTRYPSGAETKCSTYLLLLLVNNFFTPCETFATIND